MIDRGYTPERIDLNNVLSRETVALRLGISQTLDDFPAILWPVVEEAVARTKEDFTLVGDGSLTEIDFACRAFGNVMHELSNMKTEEFEGGIL